MDPLSFPDDEAGRLAAVRALDLVGTAPEPAFDRLVRLASTLLDVPIAWISLIESDRCWFKARVGLDIGETSREAALCTLAVDHPDDDVFVIEDAWLDDRYENHPLVISAPKVRFFAARVLRSRDGYALGTIAVVDREPRTLTGRDRLALADVASLAEELLWARITPAPVEPESLDSEPQLDIEPEVEVEVEVEVEETVLEEIVAETVEAAAPELDHPAVAADVTRRLEAAELMLEYTSDAIIVLDESAQLKFASPSFERILGYPIDHRPDQGALALVHPEDRPVARAAVTSAMAELEPQTFTARITTATGSIRNMECTARSLFSHRSIGGIVISMRDVSERHMLSQMLAFQSTHDRLTELPNRVLFQEHLTPALARARRDRRVVAVVSLDLAGFAELNDQLGYAAGDELLVDVAKRIRACIRSGDSAARLGNDQFAVLLDPVADAHEAVRVAERLVASVSGPHSLQAGVSDCGANAGVAVSVDADDRNTIVARAARALSQARRGGGRDVVVLAPHESDVAIAGPDSRF